MWKVLVQGRKGTEAMTSDPLSKLSRLEELAEKARTLPDFRRLPDFPLYEIRSDGSIWSHTSWRGTEARPMRQDPNRSGYLRVRLIEGGFGGKRHSLPVHQLICEAFHGPKPTPQHETRHLNGNRMDNRAENLRWGTRAENAADRKAHGTERAAENGRKSADKLRGRYNPLCRRGHDKKGQRSCYACRKTRSS